MKQGLLISAVLLACGAGNLWGGTAYGVLSSAASGAQGCGASWNYNTWAGGSGGQSTQPNFPQFHDCTNTFAGTSAPGLTAASSGVTANMQLSSNPTTFLSGTGTSAVDLSTGSLHGSADGSGGLGVNIESLLWDTLTFDIPGAIDTTTTDIPFVMSVDGILGGFPPNCSTDADPSCSSRSIGLQFGSGGVGCFTGTNPDPGICTFANLASWAWSQGSFTGFVSPPSSLVSFSVVTSTNDQFLVDGVLHLTGANPVVGVTMDMALSSQSGQSQDFSNTAALTFSPPGGATFSSASGTFGVAPEPAPLLLCGVVLVLAGCLRRYRAQV